MTIATPRLIAFSFAAAAFLIGQWKDRDALINGFVSFLIFVAALRILEG